MKVKEHLTNTANKYGYEINKDRLPILTEKFRKQVEKYGEMYCPCQQQQNRDTVCPCKYMRKYGACRCGLYKEVKVE